MNRTLKASIGAALLGTATLAVAQSPAERASGVKAIICAVYERQRARKDAHDRVVRGYVGKWLRAAVFVLIGSAGVYAAWWPFVQAASTNVQFTAAAAIADCLRRQSR